jgi:hypothetical protein
LSSPLKSVISAKEVDNGDDVVKKTVEILKIGDNGLKIRKPERYLW